MVSLQRDCTLFHLNSLLMSQIYQRMPGHEKFAENWHDPFNSSELHRNMIQDKSRLCCQCSIRSWLCAFTKFHHMHGSIWTLFSVRFPNWNENTSQNFCVRFSKINVSDSCCAICQKIVTLPKICKVSWTLSFFQCKSWPVLYTVCPRQVWWTDPKALETGMTRV